MIMKIINSIKIKNYLKHNKKEMHKIRYKINFNPKTMHKVMKENKFKLKRYKNYQYNLMM